MVDSHSYQEPLPRWGHGAVQVKGKIYMWGGEDKESNPHPASLIEVFDTRTGKWEQKTAQGVAPLGVIYSGYATIGNKLYTFGGRGKGRTYFNSLHQLDLITMKWKKLEAKNPLQGPSARRGCGVVACGKDMLVVFGGYTADSEFTNTVYVYKMKEGTWSIPTVTGTVPKRCGYSSFLKLSEHSALVFGGVAEGKRVSDVYILNMKNWHWIKTKISGKCPDGRGGHAACIIQESVNGSQQQGLLVIGGLGEGFTVLHDAWFLNLTTSSWTELELPQAMGPRCDLTATIVSSFSQSLQLMLFGGQNKWSETTIAETTLALIVPEGKARERWRLVDPAVITQRAKWIERVQLLQTLERLKSIMRQKKTINTKAVTIVFIGPPHVGKTTVINRILDPLFVVPANIPSTPVAQGPMKFLVKKVSPSMTALLGSKWVPQNFEGEKVHLVGSTLREGSPPPTENAANLADDGRGNGLQHTHDHRHQWQPVNNATNKTDNQIVTGQHKWWKKLTRQQTYQPLPTSESSSSISSLVKHLPSLETPADIFHEALRSGQLEQIEDLLQDSIMLHILDTGGQPEFLEVLPALLTCPSLNVLVFKLNECLEDRYTVEYMSPDGNKAIPYLSSFTVEEVLFQALSSVSCSLPPSSIPLIVGQNTPQSVAVFVGTHKDQVSDKEVTEVEENLQRKLKSAAIPESKVIYHPAPPSTRTGSAHNSQPPFNLVLPLDNTDSEDPGISLLQDMLTEVLQERFDGSSVPLSWLTFHLSVRSTKARVLSFQQCRRIGKICGITDDGELKLALWYLSRHCGIFRYYPEIEELQDVIITDLQVIFDRLTTLVSSTFNFQKLRTNVDIRFRETGRFSAKELARLLYPNDEIPVCKFIKLLEQLHILSPITDRSGDIIEYFLPCILPSFEVETLQREKNPAPLLITFDCAYCPLGLFSAIVVHISSLQGWHLHDGKIYRNMVTFYVGDNLDKVTFIARPTLYEVWIDREDDAPDSQPLHHVCNIIRSTVDETVTTVKSSLNSSLTIAHYIAFYCQRPGCSAVPHPAIPHHHTPKKIPLKALCSIERCPSQLTPYQRIWYGEELKEIEEVVEVNFDSLDDTQLDDGSLYEILTELVDVVNWFDVGLALGLRSSTLEIIKVNEKGLVEECRREMLIAWLRMRDSVLQKGRPSWSSLALGLKNQYPQISLELARKYMKPMPVSSQES